MYVAAALLEKGMRHALCSKGVDVELGLLLRLYPSVSSAVRERLLYRQYQLCVTDQHQAMVGVAYHSGAQFPKYHLETVRSVAPATCHDCSETVAPSAFSASAWASDWSTRNWSLAGQRESRSLAHQGRAGAMLKAVVLRNPSTSIRHLVQ